MDIIIVLSLYVMFCVLLIYFIFGGFIYGAMWMPLPKKRVKRMLELADVKGKVVFDLGAGYGNIAFKAAQEGAVVVVAVEADPFKAWWIRRQIKRKGLREVICMNHNLLQLDLSSADILLCYLSDSLMDKIAKKPLKQNAVIISACHKIKGLNPTITDKDNIYPIYVY